ncbi:MAG: hypothetical protein E7235_02270 [Lachnospiraceae bacterium]|nr:hypothetical protein [Lachnospiraceae bacterium]
MNNSLKRFIEDKNILWILLSLAIAFALWVIVINTQNPEDTKQYSVNMRVENYEMVTTAGYVVTNLDEIQNEKIRVTVKGPRMSLDNLSKNPDIVITADMSKIDYSALPGTATISLDYKLPENIDDIRIDSRPKIEVSLNLERLVTESFKAEVKPSGVASQGYRMVAQRITPSDIMVSGAESSVERVKGVAVNVDVTGMAEDTIVTAVPYAYDVAGEIVEDVNLNMNEVEIALEAHVTMTLPIDYSVNVPGEGYVVDEVICTPFELVVTGKPEVLDTIDSVVLPEIDVFNRVSSVQQVFYLDSLLPEGVRPASDTDKIIVDVKIIASADIWVDANAADVELTGKADSYEYSVRSEDYKLLLRGSGEKIFALSKDDYSVVVDVSGLEAGEYTMEAEVLLPDNIYLSGEKPQITVIVTDAQ